MPANNRAFRTISTQYFSRQTDKHPNLAPACPFVDVAVLQNFPPAGPWHQAKNIIQETHKGAKDLQRQNSRDLSE